jgi:hypothetical protein
MQQEYHSLPAAAGVEQSNSAGSAPDPEGLGAASTAPLRPAGSSGPRDPTRRLTRDPVVVERTR